MTSHTVPSLRGDTPYAFYVRASTNGGIGPNATTSNRTLAGGE